MFHNVVADQLEARVAQVAKELPAWDVVVFQEAWHARERDLLRRAGEVIRISEYTDNEYSSLRSIFPG